MTDEISITRRRLFQASGVVGGLAVAPLDVALDVALAGEAANKWALGKATPGTDSGPFYPLLNKPVDRGTDLTSISGSQQRAQGQLLYVMGQVLDMRGTPVKGVEIQVWQANSFGRYTHPSDGNPAPLDPNFSGFGVAVTDSEGRYRFKTIKPGAYPVIPVWYRPPHIHFQVTGRFDRQITQMWFPDDPLNGQDRTLANYPPVARQLMTCKLDAPAGSMEPDAKVAWYNVILANG